MAKKRTKANGEGSYFKRGNKWRGQITLGVDINGKPVRKSATGDTKAEVMEKIEQIKQKYSGVRIDSPDYTVESWSWFWLDTYMKPKLTETSYLGYERTIRNHIVPHLGYYEIKEIQPLDIQLALNRMFVDSEKYSSSTVKHIYGMFKRMMRKAEEVRLIKHNPCVGVELPKVRQAKKILSLTVDEQKKLVQRCEQEEYANIFVFLLANGMRIGEVLGLTWDNVSIEKEELYVRKTMIEIRGNPEFKDYPKTDSGLRTVHLNKKAMEIICSRKGSDIPEFNVNNLVFYSSTFNFRTTANLRRYFDRIQSEAGIPKHNLHSLRHTYATRMIEKNCNIKFLSVTLGHKDITTTLQIYSDVLADFQREQTASIDIFGD